MFTLAPVELCIYDTISTHKEKFAATWMTAATGEMLFVTDLQPSKKTLLPGNSTEQDLLASINVAREKKKKKSFSLFQEISNFTYRRNKLLGGCNLIKWCGSGWTGPALRHCRGNVHYVIDHARCSSVVFTIKEGEKKESSFFHVGWL